MPQGDCFPLSFCIFNLSALSLQVFVNDRSCFLVLAKFATLFSATKAALMNHYDSFIKISVSLLIEQWLFL